MTAKHMLFALALAPIACDEPEDDHGESGVEGGKTDDVDEEDEEDEEEEEEDEEEPAGDCEFIIDNGIDFGGYYPTIWYLYISPTGVDTWGPDQLGNQTLGYGDAVAVSGIPVGTYDVRVLDEDAYSYTQWSVECRGGEWLWYVTASDLD